MKINKLVFIGIFLVLALIIIVVILYKNSTVKTKPLENNTTQSNKDSIFADLSGNGNKDTIILTQNEDGSFKSLIAYDSKGSEIGKKPDDITIPLAPSGKPSIYKLDSSGRETIAYNFIAGTHQQNTLFFGLSRTGGNILPACFKEVPSGPYDCLFYSDDPGQLLVKDLDSDGNLEVAEVVDEYPTNGVLNQEEEGAISSAATTEGLTTDQKNGMLRIAIREKGGRGRNVIWAIYSFNGTYFVAQTGSGYDKYYNLIGDSVKNKMKRADLSADSLSYIEFARNFWQNKN